MESNKDKWIYRLIIAGLVLVILLLVTCRGSKKEIKVQIPEKNGSFMPKKPIHDTIKITDTIKGEVITVEDKELLKRHAELQKDYTEMLLAFQNYNDSTQQAKYAEAIEVKEFKTEFDNDTINIVIKGLVRGEVESIYPKWKIKKSEEKVAIPETLRILIGGGIGSNKDLDSYTVKVNLGLQDAKGNVYRASYQKIQNQDYFLGEIDFSIFEFKK